MNVIGSFLACAEEIYGKQFVNVSNGEIVYISEEEFNNYLTSVCITFNANEGVINDSEVTKVVYYGQKYGALSTPTRSNYTFAGWYTAKEGGEQITAETVVTALVNQTLYAQWVSNKFTLVYNANGGTVSTSSKELTFGDSYGTLPIPTRDYYTFLGWFTEATGGVQVSENITPSNDDDVTIYAHWQLKPVSNWVKISELPSGAQVVEQKWTYDETSYTTSTATSLSGYTQTGNYTWKQTGSGAMNYASFPSGFDTSNAIYNSFAKSVPYANSETTTTKRVISTAWAGYVYWHWMYDCGGASAGDRIILNHSGYGTKNNYNYKIFGAFTSTTNYGRTSTPAGHDSTPTYVGTGRTNHADSQGSAYWFRFDYYVCSYTDYIKNFEYKKITTKESVTEVTASGNIGNVQKWVRYREK